MAKTIKITSSNEISIVDVNFDDYRSIQKAVGGMFETIRAQSGCLYWQVNDDAGGRRRYYKAASAE